MKPFAISDVRGFVLSLSSKLIEGYNEKQKVDILKEIRHYEHFCQSVLMLYPKRLILYTMLWLVATLLGGWALIVYTNDPLHVKSWPEVLIKYMIANLISGFIWWMGFESLLEESGNKRTSCEMVLKPFLISVGYFDGPDKSWKNEAMVRSALLDLAEAKVAAQWRLKAICPVYSGNYLEVYNTSKAIIDVGVAFDAMIERARKFVDVDVSAVFRDAETRWATILTVTRK